MHIGTAAFLAGVLIGILIGGGNDTAASVSGAASGVVRYQQGHQDNRHSEQQSQQQQVDAKSLVRNDDGLCQPDVPLPMPILHHRQELGQLLEAEGFQVGAELGVQHGYFSRTMLASWPTCRRLVLVDIWANQKNYDDLANVGQTQQDEIFNTAKLSIKPWRNKVEICRNYTTSCAQLYPDDTFDYIYVDARHDRAGVLEDLRAWWPKLRCGGIMAGHDYVTQREVTAATPTQNWTLNFDGTIDTSGRVVKGAVDDFFMGPLSDGHRRQVVVCYQERVFQTWYVRK